MKRWNSYAYFSCICLSVFSYTDIYPKHQSLVEDPWYSTRFYDSIATSRRVASRRSDATFIFSALKQYIVTHDRYLLWERSTDFRFFQRISLSIRIVWLHTEQSVSTHVNLTIHIFMNFHSPLSGLLAISCVFTFVLAARCASRRLLVWNSCWITINFSLFTSIDRQNVNVQISQKAKSVNNFYSTKMTSDYLPRRFFSLLFNSVPKWREFF